MRIIGATSPAGQQQIRPTGTSGRASPGRGGTALTFILHRLPICRQPECLPPKH